MLLLCRVGAKPPPGAEEGACLGECALVCGVWAAPGGLGADWPWLWPLSAFPQWTCSLRAPRAYATWWRGCTDTQPAVGPCLTSRGRCPPSTAVSSRLFGAVTRATTIPWMPTPAAGPSCWTGRWQSGGRGTRRWPRGRPSVGGPTPLGLPLRVPRAEQPQLQLRPRRCPAPTRPSLLQMSTP